MKARTDSNEDHALQTRSTIFNLSILSRNQKKRSHKNRSSLLSNSFHTGKEKNKNIIRRISLKYHLISELEEEKNRNSKSIN